jgi:uncharacterized protein
MTDTSTAALATMGSGERIFVDTFFVVALLNSEDEHHDRAKALTGRIAAASELLITEAVLVEVCNFLAGISRETAADWVEGCRTMNAITVIPTDTASLEAGLARYRRYADKDWGLTDCISFEAMSVRGVLLAATGDHHFRQAGFIPLVE